MSSAADIESRAAEWLVQRDAGAGVDDHEFTTWLAADPRHRAAYLRLAAAWEHCANLRRLRPEGSSIDPDLLARNSRRRWGLRLWTPVALAAGLAAILCASWWFAGEGGVRTYRTEIGGLSRVVLTDGSMVTLNTDTELRVRLLPRRREITLVRGEAHFAVAHDANRPFEVIAGGEVVRAVGTAFDVRLGADRALQVVVTEGRVAVENTAGAGDDASATVSAGERAVVNSGRVTVDRLGPTEAVRQLAWEVGELSFQGETLKDALAEFNRYNQRKLRVEDPAIADLQIGGSFQALDVASFVAALQRSFNLTATTLPDGTILLQRAPDTHP